MEMDRNKSNTLHNYFKNRKRCSVPGCQAKYDNKTSFFGFPIDFRLSKIWKIKCRIKETFKQKLRICENHFDQKEYHRGAGTRNKLRRGTIPRFNLPTFIRLGNLKQQEERRQRLLKRNESKKLTSESTDHQHSVASNTSTQTQTFATSNVDMLETNCSSNTQGLILSENSPEIVSTLSTTEVDMSEAVCPSVVMEMVQSSDSISDDNDMFEQFLSLHKKCEELHHKNACSMKPATEDKCVQVNTLHDMHTKRTSVMDLLRSNKKLSSWTGIPTFQLLHCIRDCVAVGYPDEIKGGDDEPLLHKIILCFIKLKTNLTFACMASIFNVVDSTISRNFNAMLPMIRQAIEGAVYFPSKEETQANLPIAFRKYGYEKVRGILDGSEVKIQVLKCMNCRICTYSRYKSAHTFMFLLCITPGGLISHVSRGYSGKASDKMIFNSENLIEKFDPFEDSIMVDKGVLIENECLQRQIQLVRPTYFDSTLGQFEETEQVSNTKIAMLRVHVERAIQRMKIFRILTHRMEYNILPQVDNIVIICAAIANLTKPILADDKF